MSRDYKLNPSMRTDDAKDSEIQSNNSIKKGFLFGFLITISLGTFQFGYSIGVFNTLQDPFSALFGWYDPQLNQPLSTTDKSNWSTLITSICTVGSACGALFSGPVAKIGKWKAILLTNILVCVGAAITLIEDPYAILVGRFIYGIANGSFSVFVPLFINETAPTEVKGPIGVMTQLFITMGIMISFLIGLVIPPNNIPTDGSDITQADLDAWNTYKSDWRVTQYWRFMFGLPILISVIQVVLLLTVFNYETPKVLKQRKDNAKLNKLMEKIYHFSRVQERIDAIVIQQNEGKSQQGPGYKETLCDPRFRFATFVGVMLSFFQQFSGINAVMFYSNTIFSKTGFNPTTGTALVGVVNMVSTLASTGLLTRFGRKTLLWTQSILMTATLIGIGITYKYQTESTGVGILMIILMLVFVCLFEFSLGPITWIYMSEVMTEKGVSVGTLINWICAIIVALATPSLIDSIKGWLFFAFGIICGVCAIFTLLFVKETKGLSEKQVAVLYAHPQTAYSKMDDDGYGDDPTNANSHYN